VLEAEVQRPVCLVSVPSFAGELGQRVHDLVEVLAMWGIATSDHPVVRPEASVFATDACHLTQNVAFEQTHRLAVKSLSQQRRLSLP